MATTLKTKTPLYYVGVKAGGKAWIFRSREIPTSDNHPVNVKYAFGGYRTRREAERVAMYQNFLIQNDRQDDIPMWDKSLDRGY